MKYRLQLVCRDCEYPGATTCRDGGPPFVTGPTGDPLDFPTLDEANAAAGKLRGDMGTRILTEDKENGWKAVTPPPKAKSVLD
jgi:hypothetical protein